MFCDSTLDCSPRRQDARAGLPYLGLARVHEDHEQNREHENGQDDPLAAEHDVQEVAQTGFLPGLTFVHDYCPVGAVVR